MIKPQQNKPDRLISMWRAAQHLKIKESVLKEKYKELEIPNIIVRTRTYFSEKELYKWLKGNSRKLKPFRVLRSNKLH